MIFFRKKMDIILLKVTLIHKMINGMKKYRGGGLKKIREKYIWILKKNILKTIGMKLYSLIKI